MGPQPADHDEDVPGDRSEREAVDGAQPDQGTHLVPAGTRLSVRRRPNLLRFLIIGGVVGFLAGAALGYFGPDVPTSNTTQEVILMGTIGLLVGAFLASVVYLLADRASMRR